MIDTEREPTDDSDAESAAALPQFITTLAPITLQVGTHVIAALQHPSTVAVLTTVAAAPDGSQQIISLSLDAERLEQIQRLLASADREHAGRVQCFGFHCRFEADETDGPAAA
jgi:hypothetical protein